MNNLIPVELIENKIYIIRGQKVMLASDLAKLYCVPTKRLNEQVKRNSERFPLDFMFRLNLKEAQSIEKHHRISDLRSQFATSKWGGSRYRPYVFTEQGVAMLSSVLNSKRAIQVNIAIMRTFVKLRQILSSNKELAQKLKDLEQKYEKHDIEIQSVFEAIRQLMLPKEKPSKKFGFHPWAD